jgi:hypothetical protein
VWARLKVLGGVRVSRKRVLRIMREQHLLSPRRVRRESVHDISWPFEQGNRWKGYEAEVKGEGVSGFRFPITL